MTRKPSVDCLVRYFDEDEKGLGPGGSVSFSPVSREQLWDGSGFEPVSGAFQSDHCKEGVVTGLNYGCSPVQRYFEI